MKLLSVAPDTVTSAAVKSLVVPLAVKVNVSALSLDVEPLATAPEPFAAVIMTEMDWLKNEEVGVVP